ncbi:CBS domain-containing protein [Flaviflexus huanghaiensis]|uniref:CBS domain-containing protein n=1 Tax=Flaviflexus huanghaiensis TaxID=1111473 RepID=UPI0015FAF2DD|nr:CBS domain-containing protein [Flaviflexus huanghaiensis]
MAKVVNDDAAVRSRLALLVSLVGVVGICLISVVLLAFSNDEDRPEMARLVYASVLPLIGTWIGTILAFYFAKENLQAASTTTLETLKLSGVFSEETKAADVMISVGKISPIRRVADKGEAGELRLQDLYNSMRQSKYSRVPILTTSGVALMVVHESDIDKYAQLNGRSAASLAADETVSRMLATPELRQRLEAFIALPESATVGDARREFEKTPAAKDLFITSNGKTTGRVLGWLTLSDLARSM